MATHQFPLGLIQVLALKDDAVGHDDFADIVNRRGVSDQPHLFGRQVHLLSDETAQSTHAGGVLSCRIVAQLSHLAEASKGVKMGLV